MARLVLSNTINKQDDEKETLLLMRRPESLGFGASNGATALAGAGEEESRGFPATKDGIAIGQ